jgi:DNA-binding PadR family transcriptional regulator
MTMPTQAVLRALLVDPSQEQYGLELCAAAKLPSGTVHPILARLESAGWVESRWETVNPEEAGRPRRRYYRLNPDGVAHAQAALARSEAKADRLATRLRFGFADGDA